MSFSGDIARNLAEISGTDANDWFIVSRTRHGMAAVLRVLAELRGPGEVITQAFTCATALNPILAAGHRPVYVDIQKDTLSLDPRLAEAVLSTETRCVIVQHTLGLEAPIAMVNTALRAKSPALLMEDSAHVLGRVSRLADVSVHSFGAEKVLSTSVGGAVWLNPNMLDQELREALMHTLSALPNMPALEELRYRIYPYINALMNRTPKFMQGLRSVLQSLKVFITPVMPTEQRGKMYGSPSKLPDSLAKKVVSQLEVFKAKQTRRCAAVQHYDTYLKGRDVYPHALDTPLVRYPVRTVSLEAADTLFSGLRAKGYTIGKWYRPLLFPGVQDQALYLYKPGSCPVAEEESARIINLPTNCELSVAEALTNELNS